MADPDFINSAPENEQETPVNIEPETTEPETTNTFDPTATPSEPIAQESLVSQPPKSHFPKWLLIVIALLLLAGGFFAYMRFKPAPKTTPQPAIDSKKDIASFTYGGLTGPFNTFFPSTGTNVDEYTMNEQVFEGLVVYRDKKIVPNLATGWTNPDASTWVFKLKPNVKFHTNRTMGADDVKASFEQMKDTEIGGIFGSTIKSVDVIDPMTVKITTDGPDPVLLNKLVFLFIIDGKSPDKSSPLNGTGPYTIKQNTQASEKAVDLVAFDNYHGGRPYIRELRFKVIDSDEAMAEALTKGELNLASFSAVEAADPLKSKYEPFYIDDPTVFGLYLNTVKTGPLQKLKVRQAIYEAINVDEFLKNIGTSGTAANQLVIKDIPGYNPDIKRPVYNVEHAKQLLKEAGYPNGFTMQFTYLQTVSVLQQVADELTRQLKPVGITIKPNPYTDRVNNATKTGQTDSYYQGYSSDILDLSDVFGTNFQATKYYNNVQVNAVMDEANKTLDPAARLNLLKQVSKQTMDDVAYVPIFSGTAAYLLDKTYVIPVDLPATSYPGVYFWRVYQK